MLLLNHALSFIQNLEILIHWLIMTCSSVALACAVQMLWSAIPFILHLPATARHIPSNDKGSGGGWGMMAKPFPAPARVSLCLCWALPALTAFPARADGDWHSLAGSRGSLWAHSHNCCCFKDDTKTFLSPYRLIIHILGEECNWE